MIKALSHLLYAIGLKPVPVPLSRGEPVHEVPVPVSKNPQTNGAAFAHDTVAGENRKEPAMAVIPKDAVQMPPPWAASPGLPPVDPVGDFVSRTDTAVASYDLVKTELSDASPATDSVAVVTGGQEISPADLSKNVAPKQAVNPWSNPSPSQTETMPRNRNLRGDDFAEDAACVNAVSCAQIGLFPATPEICEHSGAGEDKKRLHDSSHAKVECDTGLDETAQRQAWPQILGFDSRSQDPPPCANKPAKSSKRVPPRIADRPHIEEWTDDELLTLPEAAALFWPGGPITTNTLRTAGRDGTLAITKVAGKFFTTPMAIRRMGQEGAGEALGRETVDPSVSSPRSLFEAKLEEARRQGRDRKRRQRAAKRSVAPLDTGAGR